jgi:hypothetical protein
MTHRGLASNADGDIDVTETPGHCVAVTRSESAHPGDWGRAISLALEYLAVQVAFTERKPEPGILIGHAVRLRFEANGGGAVIRAELDSDPAPDLDEVRLAR